MHVVVLQLLGALHLSPRLAPPRARARVWRGANLLAMISDACHICDPPRLSRGIQHIVLYLT